MANYEVVAAVSMTLSGVLTEALAVLTPLPAGPPPKAELHDLQFDNSSGDPGLTVFLFEVGEDPSARNRPRLRENTPPDVTIRKAPMALLLRYLLTAWGGNQETQQRILGRAIQALYDKPILSGPDLKGVLAGSDEAIKMTMSPLSLEERTRVFHAVQRAYRLSVCYEARVINLDSEQTARARPVGRRTLDFEELENDE